MARHILKIGLACVRDGRLLLVRKAGHPSFILPGGKPEAGEDEVATLQRELGEELGASATDLRRLGEFTNAAADLDGVTVTVVVYAGDVVGEPSPRAEIEEMAWSDGADGEALLAPSLSQQIVPMLRREGLLLLA